MPAMKRVLCPLSAVLTLAMAAPASAAEAVAPPAGAETHDGFFLRLNLGLGAVLLGNAMTGRDISINGFGEVVGIAAGGAIVRDLILYGELIVHRSETPTVTINGEKLAGSGLKAATGCLGLGAAYYFGRNVYASGTLGLSSMNRELPDDHGSTDWGPAASVLVGKEWWTSANTAIGAALRTYLGRMSEGGRDHAWSAFALMAGVSATYN
jgi:hypothetical protein